MMRKSVPSFEDYEVDETGKIWSKRGQKYLKLGKGNTVTLYRSDGRFDYGTVAKITANAFVENPNGYSYVRHKDGNVNNNHYKNLEWCDVRSKRAVIHTDKDGNVTRYSSAKEAAEKTGTSVKHIFYACSNGQTRRAGKEWRYENL